MRVIFHAACIPSTSSEQILCQMGIVCELVNVCKYCIDLRAKVINSACYLRDCERYF